MSLRVTSGASRPTGASVGRDPRDRGLGSRQMRPLSTSYARAGPDERTGCAPSAVASDTEVDVAHEQVLSLTVTGVDAILVPS